MHLGLQVKRWIYFKKDQWNVLSLPSGNNCPLLMLMSMSFTLFLNNIPTFSAIRNARLPTTLVHATAPLLVVRRQWTMRSPAAFFHLPARNSTSRVERAVSVYHTIPQPSLDQPMTEVGVISAVTRTLSLCQLPSVFWNAEPKIIGN